jgi:superfamily II DNA helicase RecQ
LHVDGILDFTPGIEGNTLTYLESRPTKIRLDKQNYLQLRDREEYRKEYLAKYEGTAISCRENYLLAYFGEVRHEICGKCDLCRLGKKANIGNSALSQMIAQIKSITLDKNLDLDAIVSSFGAFQEEQIVGVIKWLLDNQYLTKIKQTYTWNLDQES